MYMAARVLATVAAHSGVSACTVIWKMSKEVSDWITSMKGLGNRDCESSL